METENEEALEMLEKFVLRNPELERLEHLLSQFNIFQTLKIVQTEVIHSNFLSWLLDPTANHGLGDYFVKRFLKDLVSKNKNILDPMVSLFDFEIFDYSELELRREWNSIDILMIITERDKKYVVVIENKVKSSEHSNQLQRYRAIVEDEFKDYIKIYVYLTPDELPPSDDNWISFGYSAIADLLDDLIRDKQSILNDNVHNFISQYNTMLRRYIVGQSEIEQICQQIYKKHREALDLIFNNKPDTVSEISEYLQSQLKQYEDTIIVDSTAKTFVRFTTNILDNLIEKIGEGWTRSRRILLFEFNNYDRLVLRLYIGPVGLSDQTYRDKLIEFVRKEKALFKLASRVYVGKKWHAIYQNDFLSKTDYIDANMFDLKPKIDKSLSEFMHGDLLKINEYFQNNWPSTTTPSS